jgi:serine phosphatase RsbU (regulator of sigma subunit)
MKTILLTFFLFFMGLGFGQKMTEAQYLEKIANTTNDSVKGQLYLGIAHILTRTDKEKSLIYCNKAYELSKKIKNGFLLATTYEAMADANWYAFNNTLAVKYYLLEQRVADSINNKFLKARSIYNIGWIRCIQQNEKDQVHYLYSAYHTFLQLKDTGYVLSSLDALGSYYKGINKNGSYNDSVKKYYTKAIFLIEHSAHKVNQCACYCNMAEYYNSISDYKTALSYFNKAFLPAQKQNDTYSLLIIKQSIAKIYYNLDSIPKALKLLEDIKPLIENDPQQLENKKYLYNTYFNIYKSNGDFKTALAYFEGYKAISDSLNQNIFNSNLKAQENNYENELNEKTITDLKQRNELSDLRNRNSKTAIYALSGIILLVGCILILLFRSIKQNRRTNTLLKDQNKIISLKKEEIEQSIQYAKGIQSGILPDKNILDAIIPNNFIFYLPKDIVSGDFYWFQKIDNVFYIAAADCTGHGVPGALMSVVSIDKLNQALFEQRLTEPEAILSAINQSIKLALKQNDGKNNQKDGLDIAFIKYEPELNRITYAGANRPLWLIRNEQLEEFKPTKMAIAGHSPNEQVYTQISIELKPSDQLFLFSDGYADQFGGDSGKKLMTKKLKDILLNNSKLDIASLSNAIETHFYDWKKNHEQVDDVLVIGLKV